MFGQPEHLEASKVLIDQPFYKMCKSFDAKNLCRTHLGFCTAYT